MIAQQMVNALSLGASYALVALGFTLVFGVLRILNMAHGSIAIVGAYVALVVSSALHLNLLVSVLVGMIVAGMIGALTERLVIRPTITNEMAPFIATLGLTMVLENGLSEVFGPDPKGFPSNVGVGTYEFWGMTITATQLLMTAVSIGLLVGLSYMVMRTQLGRYIRATAESRETAAFLGVDTGQVGLITLVIASTVAGAAGVLLGQYFGVLTPFIGTNIAVKGLIVLIVGGMGNFYGAMITGLILGFVEVFATVYLSSSFGNMAGYILLVVILLIKPSGLFGSTAAARD